LALNKGKNDLQLQQEALMPLDRKRVEQLFADALDLTDPDARTRMLERECGADPALRRRVEELLAADKERLCGFMPWASSPCEDTVASEEGRP
jgi:hypothetical protein